MKNICFLLVLAVWSNPAAQAPTVAPKDAPSKITIVGKEEPGERLVVSGRVFGQKGLLLTRYE
jgi:hypothetical protein